MKSVSVLLSIFGAMALFGFGFTMNQSTSARASVEQIHLSCWNEEENASVERLRLVLNKSLHGLIWLSSFQGDPLEEGTLAPTADPAAEASSFSVNVLTASQSFIAQIPSFVFQPHVRSLKLTIEKDQVASALKCQKINLQKRQSASSP
jgi:hypothetical protein